MAFSSIRVAALADKVPWRFGREPDANKKEYGKEELQRKRTSVSPTIYPLSKALDGSVEQELTHSYANVDASRSKTSENYWSDLVHDMSARISVPEEIASPQK